MTPRGPWLDLGSTKQSRGVQTKAELEHEYYTKESPESPNIPSLERKCCSIIGDEGYWAAGIAMSSSMEFCQTT